MTKMPTKPPITHIFVIGHNAYGRATNVRDALLNWFREASPYGTIKLSVRGVDDEAQMDGIGNLSYRNKLELPDIEMTKAEVQEVTEVLDLLVEKVEPAVEMLHDNDVWED